MLGEIMDRGWPQVTFVDRLFDRRGECVGAVSTDLARRQKRFTLKHFVEETLCCTKISIRGEQKIHGIAVLVYGEVQIFLGSAHLDISLIYPSRPAMVFAKPTQTFFDERSIGQKPIG